MIQLNQVQPTLDLLKGKYETLRQQVLEVWRKQGCLGPLHGQTFRIYAPSSTTHYEKLLGSVYIKEQQATRIGLLDKSVLYIDASALGYLFWTFWSFRDDLYWIEASPGMFLNFDGHVVPRESLTAETREKYAKQGQIDDINSAISLCSVYPADSGGMRDPNSYRICFPFSAINDNTIYLAQQFSHETKQWEANLIAQAFEDQTLKNDFRINWRLEPVED